MTSGPRDTGEAASTRSKGWIEGRWNRIIWPRSPEQTQPPSTLRSQDFLKPRVSSAVGPVDSRWRSSHRLPPQLEGDRRPSPSRARTALWIFFFLLEAASTAACDTAAHLADQQPRLPAAPCCAESKSVLMVQLTSAMNPPRSSAGRGAEGKVAVAGRENNVGAGEGAGDLHRPSPSAKPDPGQRGRPTKHHEDRSRFRGSTRKNMKSTTCGAWSGLTPKAKGNENSADGPMARRGFVRPSGRCPWRGRTPSFAGRVGSKGTLVVDPGGGERPSPT